MTNLKDLRDAALKCDHVVGRLVLHLIEVARTAHVACGDGLLAMLAAEETGPYADLCRSLQRLDAETKKP